MNNRRQKLIYKISQSLNIQPDRLMTLSDEQTNYINLRLDKSTFLEACPGSGKTEVISLKFCYAVKRWQKPIAGIANLTFTTGAAKVLSNRINQYLDFASHPHFIGTFDSWLHSYILQPYAHTLISYQGVEDDKSIRIVEDDSNASFLNAFSITVKFNDKVQQVAATKYYFSKDWNQIYSSDEILHKGLQNISKSDFKNLLENKIKFIQKGFATYIDAEILSIKILDKFPWLALMIAKRFPVVFIDECQDLSEQQITIIEHLQKNGSTIHCVGDINQSIYKFRKVDPKSFTAYAERNNFNRYYLSANYRSNQLIVNICNALIASANNIKGNEEQRLKQPILLWQYDSTNFSDLPLKFENLINSHGLNLKASAILARAKNTIAPLKNQNERSTYSKSELIALAVFTWSQPHKTTEMLNDALRYMGYAISALGYTGSGNYKQQLCPKHIDQITWRLFLKKLLDLAVMACPFENNGQDVLWPVWISSLKVFLKNNWLSFLDPANDFQAIKAKIKTPNHCTELPVKNLCNFKPVHNLIRTTTIHSVKGETLDAVLLISHPNKKSGGGHHSHWITANAKDDEHVRFAFVACSRPKHLLILATPKLSAKEILDLKAIGFS